jgi:hypothetical protein
MVVAFLISFDLPVMSAQAKPVLSGVPELDFVSKGS